MTYSIVARDPETGELAMGSQSHFFGVGRLVGWLEPGVGTIATQAFVNVDYGPTGIALLGSGSSAPQVLDTLLDGDELREFRQIGIVDAHGGSAHFTGSRCVPSAGGYAADGVAVQGNMLASDAVYESMLGAFHAASGTVVDKVLAAMRAAEDAGGDARGSQSAVLKSVSGSRSATPWQESRIDLRVDDHPDPIGELERLLPIQRAFDAVGGVIFTPGLMLGPYEGVSEVRLESTLAMLASAEGALGDNLEAAFWRATLLARAGRTVEAETLYGSVFERGPHLAAYRDSIGAAGFLDGTDDIA